MAVFQYDFIYKNWQIWSMGHSLLPPHRFLTPGVLEICFDPLYLQVQPVAYRCRHGKRLMRGERKKANKDEGKEGKKEGRKKELKEAGRWPQQGA